jgi:hypothetical protein
MPPANKAEGLLDGGDRPALRPQIGGVEDGAGPSRTAMLVLTEPTSTPMYTFKTGHLLFCMTPRYFPPFSGRLYKKASVNGRLFCA